MRPGPIMVASILVWSVISAGALAAAEEADKGAAPAASPPTKAAPDAAKEPAPEPAAPCVAARGSCAASLPRRRYSCGVQPTCFLKQ